MTQTVMGGQDGSIYLVTADGDLLWYGDANRNGTLGWRANSGDRIGTGWQDARLVFGGPDGVLYAIRHNGDLLWYRDAHRDGTPGWAPGSGQRIGNGWQDIRLAFSDEGGIIYGVHNSGDLYWYRDAHRNGTPGWAPGSGQRIGSGWQDVRLALGGADGIIYAIKSSGDLHWYRDAHQDGTPGWAVSSGNIIGSGWGSAPHAFSGGSGIIYGVDAAGLLRWYRDVPRDGTPGWGPRSGEIIGSGWLGAEWNPSLPALGHGSKLQNGKPALGPRRLIILLAEYTNNANDDFPSFASVHAPDYYEKLGFGQPVPPFSTDSPVNPASLNGYFRECSLGRFWFERAGVIGPLQMGVLDDAGPEARSQRIIGIAAQHVPWLFLDADVDGDDVISSSEMVVLLVENIRALYPANRDNYPVQVRVQIGPVSLTRTVTLHVAFAGPLTPFYQIAHEVSHSLGTVDLYNSGAGNSLITLMGGYSFYSNDQGIVHVDAWHKLALGWCEPRRRRLTRAGNELLLEATPARPTAPVILWHPERGAAEYFLLERRTPTSDTRRYDGNLPGDGALIWRVTPAAGPYATHLGAPDLTVGGSGFWKAGETTPPLVWTDGSPVGLSLAFYSPLGPSLRPPLRVQWS